MTFDIGDAIQRLRDLRTRFLIDTPALAYESSVAMVKRFWPLESAQLDNTKFHSHIYRPNPNADDQEQERQKQRNSAILAKLSLPDWGYADNTGKSREQLINELDRDLVLMQKDGLHPYERYVEKRTEPAITPETARHYQSLTPRVRAQLFGAGLSIAAPAEKRMGRKRSNPVDPNTAFRTAPFLRSRENWRPDQIFIACKALHAVAGWVNEQEADEPLLRIYAERYRLANLYVSDSKVAPKTFAAKLAVAIASADHLESGTDEYAPNDDIARGAFLMYGLYLQSIAGPKKPPQMPPERCF